MPSTTGAPEGDPVSVLVMTGLCTVFSGLVSATPRTFVDNWGWSSPSRRCHVPVVAELQKLETSLKLQVDWGKSYCFATCPDARKWLRENVENIFPQAIPLLSQVKELGAHLQFSRHRVLGHLPDRIHAANAKLHKLYHSSAPLESKALAIQNSVWPSAFFGMQALAPGRQRLQSLRSNAARVLVGRHHTLSPYAALQLLPSVQDPEPYLMIQQVRQLKRAFSVMPDIALTVLRNAAEGGALNAVYGPASAMFVMFSRNDWCILPTGEFKGPGHAWFSVRSSCMRAISKAILSAWAISVQAACVHRNGLHDMPVMCREGSVHNLRKFRPWEQVVLSRHMCGAFMSQAERKTWSTDTSEVCCLCGEKDTKAHRLFECEPLACIREPFLEVLREVRRFRPWWVHMLAASEYEDEPMFRLMSTTRKLPGQLPPPDGGCLHIFTDGSARHSSCPAARLTYWSVVQACTSGDTVQPDAWVRMDMASKVSSFKVICLGCTPGEQTVPRAELAAVAWAMRWIRQRPNMRAVIYCDCQFVVDLWRRVEEGARLVDLPHSDLSCHLMGVQGVRVLKVKAHNDKGKHPTASPLLQWQTAGNEAADAAARQAQAQEMCLLRDLSDSIAAHRKLELAELYQFSRYLIEVNVYELRLKEAVRMEEEVEAAHRRTLPREADAAGVWDPLLPWSAAVPPDLPASLSGLEWGDEYVHSLFHWASRLKWPPRPVVDGTFDTVTFLELFVHHTAWSNLLPPVKVRRASSSVHVVARTLEGIVQPRSLEQALGTFLEVIMAVRKRFEIMLIPGLPVCRLCHLKLLGLHSVQNGIPSRPWFPEAPGWTLLLRDVCNTHAYPTIETFVKAANHGLPISR